MPTRPRGQRPRPGTVSLPRAPADHMFSSRVCGAPEAAPSSGRAWPGEVPAHRRVLGTDRTPGPEWGWQALAQHSGHTGTVGKGL